MLYTGKFNTQNSRQPEGANFSKAARQATQQPLGNTRETKKIMNMFAASENPGKDKSQPPAFKG